MASTPILVTSYARPDLDGFGGAWAYAELLNQQNTQAVARFFATPRGEELYVMDLFGGEYPATIPNDSEFDQVILVDSSDMGGFDGLLTPTKVVEVIDHRFYTDKAIFPNAKFQLEPVGAAATLIAERWFAWCYPDPGSSLRDPAAAGRSNLIGLPRPTDGPRNDKTTNAQYPTPLSAALLLGGIISNTQNFQANVTTERDHAMNDWLRSQLELPADFVTHLFEKKSDLMGDKLHERFMGETALFELGRPAKTSGVRDSETPEVRPERTTLRVMISQIEMIGATDLVTSRRTDILHELHEQAAIKQADRYFLSLLDVGGGYNLFVTDDPVTQQLLTATLHVKFDGPIARREGVIMRKEIVPKLKAHLERSSINTSRARRSTSARGEKLLMTAFIPTRSSQRPAGN